MPWTVSCPRLQDPSADAIACCSGFHLPFKDCQTSWKPHAMSQTTVLPFVTRPAPQEDEFRHAPPKQNGGAAPLAGFMRVLGHGEEGRERQQPIRRPPRGILVPGQQMPHVILNTVQVMPLHNLRPERGVLMVV